jgi:hypothetical protein
MPDAGLPDLGGLPDIGGGSCGVTHSPPAATPPSLLNTQPSSPPPVVAADASGHAAAAWAQLDPNLGGRTVVMVQTYDPATGWSAANLISNTNLNSASPALAVDATPGSGPFVILSFVETDTLGNNTVKAGVFDFSVGAWQAPVPLSSPTSFPISVPRAAMNNGHGAVAWSVGSANAAVYVANLATASPPQWLGETQLSATSQDASEFDLAINASGNAALVYASFYATYAPVGVLYVLGAWQAPQNLTADPNGRAPRVVFDDHGVATAIWLRTSDNSLLANRTTIGWNTSGAIPISGSAAPTLPGARLAVDSCGDVQVVFENAQGAGLFGSFFSGAVWTGPSMVAPGTFKLDPSIDLGMTVDGTALAVFSGSPMPGGAPGIFASQIVAGSMRATFLIEQGYNPMISAPASSPAIGVSTGKGFVIWNQTPATQPPDTYEADLTWN